MNLDRVIAVRNNKTIYRDGERCVKVFHSGYSKAAVLNEALNQARIEQTDLRVPRIIEVTTNDDRWAIVSEYIKGKTLAQNLSQCPEEKNEAIRLLVQLQTVVHSTPCPQLGRLSDALKSRIEAATQEPLRTELLQRLAQMPQGEALCHGDFNPTNIILPDGAEPYILDWSDAMRGDAAADVARTYLLLHRSYGEAFAEEYLALLCEQTRIDAKTVQRWLPLVAAAQLARSNEDERRFLMPWVAL